MANNGTTIINTFHNMILSQSPSKTSIPTRYDCRIATNGANWMIFVAFERSNYTLWNDGQDLQFDASCGKLHSNWNNISRARSM